MENKTVKVGTIIAIILLNLWAVFSAYAQAQIGQQTRQDVGNRVNCIICKITSLAILIAIPLIIFSSPLVFLLGLAILLIFYDKMKKAKDEAARLKAKKALKVTLACMGAFLIVAVVAAVIMFTGMIGGDCRNVCYSVVG